MAPLSRPEAARKLARRRPRHCPSSDESGAAFCGRSEALAAADRNTRRELAISAARLAARLHGAGFTLRDFKPPNLIVPDKGGLVLVDLDDVRQGGNRYRARNLASLDAYGQLGPRPLGVQARWQALGVYCHEGQLEPRAWWQRVLRLSRAKRKRWQCR